MGLSSDSEALQRTSLDWKRPISPISLRHWISNADATLEIVPTPSGQVPVLIPNRSTDQGPFNAGRQAQSTRLAERAWVTCLWSGSAGYAIDEWTSRLDPRWANAVGPAAQVGARLSWLLGPWRAAVQVGSWPLSTTLRETLSATDLIRVLDRTIERFPDRPVALRHVFSESPPALLNALFERRFRPLPARVVYSLGVAQALKPKASHLKRDLSLLARSDLRTIGDAEFTQEDMQTALTLYRSVYRDRHSRRNPDYSVDFIQWARSRGLLELLGLRSPCGQLRAFAARHHDGATTSVPMLGYDLEADRRDGLYRQLVASLVREAAERRQNFDFSSGAGDFKRKRGFEPRLEMTMLRAPSKSIQHWPAQVMLRLLSNGSSFFNMERLIAAGA